MKRRLFKSSAKSMIIPAFTLSLSCVAITTALTNQAYAGWWSDVTDTVEDAADTVADTTEDVVDTVVDETVDAAETVADETADAAETVADETVDAAETVWDWTTSPFTSAEDVLDTVTGYVDTSLETIMDELCIGADADDSDDDSATDTLVDDCDIDLTSIEDVWETTEEAMYELASEVESTLVEIAQDSWEFYSEEFADVVDQMVDFFSETTYGNLQDVAETAVDTMTDVESVFAALNFDADDISSNSSVYMTYSNGLSYGNASLDLIVNGTFSEIIEYDGTDYMSLTGSITAWFAIDAAAAGYTPEVFAYISYSNPILKIENGAITGLLVDSEYDGSINLAAGIRPVMFSASLSDIIEYTGISASSTLTDAVKIVADIGSVEVSMPLTDADEANASLTIWGGIDFKVSIANGWSIKLRERVSWSDEIDLEVPSELQISDSSVFSALIGDASESCDPLTPYNLTSSDVTDSMATLAWEDDSTALSHYNVRYSVAGESDWTKVKVDAGEFETTVSDLSSSTDYEWQVRAICEDETSSDYWDTDGSFTTASSDDCSPYTPYSLLVDDITDSSASLEWEDDYSVNLSHYNVRYSIEGENDWTKIKVDAADDKVASVSELSDGTGYDWQVRGICADDTGSDYWDTDGYFITND